MLDLFKCYAGIISLEIILMLLSDRIVHLKKYAQQFFRDSNSIGCSCLIK